MIKSNIVASILWVWISAIAAPAFSVEIAISCGATGVEFELCKQGANAWAKRTGNQVRFISTPNSTSERLALYQQLLAAGDSAIDVFQIDVIWPGILHRHFIDLAPYFSAAELKSHFPAALAAGNVAGAQIGIPWFTDAGLLYYRKDLLDRYRQPVPKTWEDLAVSAWVIQQGERERGQKKFWGYVWQGRNYEGLTCNALEWISSFGGGSIVEADGRVSINNPLALQAVEVAASWIGNISPKGVLSYGEEEARGAFQSGYAAFMRNWPYAWKLLQSGDSAVKGKVGVVMLPQGGEKGRHSATLGGWQLGVSKYSRHPKEAADLVRSLTGVAEQKRRAIAGSFNPTVMALYRDSDVLAAAPFMGQLYGVFVSAVPRPSAATGRKYNQVSSAFWNSVYTVLSGSESAADSFAALERRLQRIGKNGKW